MATILTCTGTDPHELATRFDRYGEFKQAVADAVVATVNAGNLNALNCSGVDRKEVFELM